jgi:hypothetical protein
MFMMLQRGEEVEEEEEREGGMSSQQSFTGFKLILTLHSGHTTISGAAEETNKEPPE